MRPACALLVAIAVWLLPLALGSDRAAAVFTCGMFDGKFQCRATQGGAVHGKNALPGVDDPSRKRETPEATGVEPLPAAPAGTAPPAGEASSTGCAGGMVGTPPNCQCPQNSELLGGNCVHYTATTCSSGLAADALPQACARVEEKLSCKMRQDGMKDCCCVVYDKL